jgi:hypothetical protein
MRQSDDMTTLDMIAVADLLYPLLGELYHDCGHNLNDNLCTALALSPVGKKMPEA